MKCATCGWLLSPNRPTATCPRCGSPAESSQKSTVGSVQAGGAPWASNGANAPSMPGIEQGQAGASTTPKTYNAPGYQTPLSPPVEPWRQTGQGGQPGQAGTFTPSSFSPIMTGYGGPPPPKNDNPKVGFIVAGLCIVVGALLLVFVYVTAVGGQGNTSTASNITPTVSSPTAAMSPSPTSASPTATTYPAQQYINNAQMSSSPPPIQATTTFHPGQKIYVTFDLHPQGQKGTVCLIWYLNGQQATTYNFASNGGNTSTYAYATLGGTGPGYVELYWASDTTCSNKQLAQSVSFTLSK